MLSSIHLVYLLYSLHPLNWQGVVGFFHPLTLGRKEVGWFSVGSSVGFLFVVVAAAFAAVDVATAAVVVAFAFADVAVVAVVAAVAVLALLLLEEVRFVRTGDGLDTTRRISSRRIMMSNEDE